jgi:polyisoprenoid-binding protein YceI
MKVLFTYLFVIVSLNLTAQKYVAEKTLISFFSTAPLEDISAKNQKAVSIFNADTKQIAYSVPIKEFQFAKSLMKEHFNEKYLHSDKYPKSTFEGIIEGYEKGSLEEQQVIARGKLTIHGVTKDIEAPGTISTDGKKLLMKSKFTIKLKDYNIEIPQLLWQNIAEQVEVTLDFVYAVK